MNGVYQYCINKTFCWPCYCDFLGASCICPHAPFVFVTQPYLAPDLCQATKNESRSAKQKTEGEGLPQWAPMGQRLGLAGGCGT